MSLRLEQTNLAKAANLLALGLAFSLSARAQTNVGELLDAGAIRMSVEEFKVEVVQRAIFGPTASGGTIEVIYARNGSIAGTGTPLQAPKYAITFPVSGEWRIDNDGRICTTMRIQGGYSPVTLPPRCQVWLKYRDDYFIADSDSDRLARVLRRTVKR